MTGPGELGEILVADRLSREGWKILYRNWRTRYGEIDIIALGGTPPLLAFVEVKTRGENNWDAGGRLAVDRRKQRKLSRTAAMFLSRHPQLCEYPCRFDVALVEITGGALRFAQYIENAFDFAGG